MRGWIKIMSYMSPRESIYQFPSWLIKVGKTWQTFDLEDGRAQGKGFLVKFDGVDDCDEARAYMHCDIAIYADELPELEEGEYYWKELIGLTVINLQNENLGVVHHLIETGANDVLSVKTKDTERLIPYIDSAVIDIDLDAQQMIVDWPSDWD